jgi:hypothetical protein
MNPTNTVRAILRDHPAARYDVTHAYIIYLSQYAGENIHIENLINLATFLRTWQRYRRSFL